ncbi:MAG: hypothetical protein ACK5JN_02635 [Kluyvera sp.]|uniref:hypothetical protein n=1 Tax=Kluyvera sp. TaxID=1538228 RepID=UPI003A87B387
MKIVHGISLALVGLMLSSVAQAQSRVSSGTIHFIGQVVEGACDVSSHRQTLQIACYRDGEHRVQQVTMSTTDNAPIMPIISKIDRRTLPGTPHLQEVTIHYL